MRIFCSSFVRKPVVKRFFATFQRSADHFSKYHFNILIFIELKCDWKNKLLKTPKIVIKTLHSMKIKHKIYIKMQIPISIFNSSKKFRFPTCALTIIFWQSNKDKIFIKICVIFLVKRDANWSKNRYMRHLCISVTHILK